MDKISLAVAHEQWVSHLGGCYENDAISSSESWNNYTDVLTKDGELHDLQYYFAPSFDEEMPGYGKKYDELADDRAFILEQLGITIDTVFVPFSQSRNAHTKEPSLNWKVTLNYNDKSVLTTDYTQGSNYCSAHNDPGRFKSGEGDMRTNACRHSTRRPVPAPNASDVLESLLLDSEVLDYGTFEEWASYYGYDTDSRKAEKIYLDCLSYALLMRSFFGGKLIRQLRELFVGI